MAGVQGQNQLLDLARALKRRRYQVLVPALLVATLGIAFAVIVPKRYRVLTRIQISDRTRVEFDSRLKNPQEVALRREAPSAQEHLRNFSRVKEVIESNLAQWPEYVNARTEMERAEFINRGILANLSAAPTSKDPKTGSIFIDVGYSDEDKARAARFLQDLTQSWLLEMRETDRETLITERGELQEIVDAQSLDLTEKETRFYALIELLGEDPTAPSGNNSREARGDWTFRTLDKAKTDLGEVEFQLRTAEFELEQSRARLLAEPDTLPKRVPIKATDPAAMLEKLALQREHLEEQLSNLRPSNSQYKRLKPELDEIVAEMEELASQEPDETERWENEDNPLKPEYELAVRTKEDEVGRLKEQRTALGAHIADLEEKSKARTQQHKHLDDLRNQVSEARALFNETRRQWADRDKSLQMLDSSPAPWRIAQPPVPSSAATQPNPFLLSAFSVFAGLALGVGLAVLSEYARSSYRSVADLASVMSVPVLGAIDTIVTRRERRRLQLSRAVAGLSTAVIVGTIGWVTWLWHSSPERLPLEVQGAIERMRSALK